MCCANPVYEPADELTEDFARGAATTIDLARQLWFGHGQPRRPTYSTGPDGTQTRTGSVPYQAWACSISWEVGSRPDPWPEHRWNAAADQFMDEMGFNPREPVVQVVDGEEYTITPQAEWLGVLFDDSRRVCLHLVASPVRYDGAVVSRWQDYRRAQHAAHAVFGES